MSATLHYLTLTDPASPARPRHLAYYEWGEAANPRVVICVHGLTRNARDFDSLAQALMPRYRVLCVDMAGRGKSDWCERKADYNPAVYMADTLALLAHQGLSSVDWIGTSMGGIIGMLLAAQQPACIKRMVLNDVGAVISAAGLKRILAYAGAAPILASAEDAMQHLKSIAAPFGINSEAEWKKLFDASFVSLPGGGYAPAYDPDVSEPFRESSSKGEAIVDIDMTPVWNAVQCPVLILRGGQSDILSHETALAMRSRSALTKLVEFPGVGHVPALLDETQIKVVTDWLDIP